MALFFSFAWLAVAIYCSVAESPHTYILFAIGAQVFFFGVHLVAHEIRKGKQ